MIENPYYSDELHGPYEIFEAGDFELENGGCVHGLKLAYAVHGTLNEAKDNAILVPTWYSGTSRVMADLRMLVPRASGIGFYDAHGHPLWVSEDYDGPDPQPVVDEAIAKAPAATTPVIDGFSRDFAGAPAYAFLIRDDFGQGFVQ